MNDKIDPGLDANRDSSQSFRYRVRTGWDGQGWKYEGHVYAPGEEVILMGLRAYRNGGYALELVDPIPVVQTEDPATWNAQYATCVNVHLNSALCIHHDGCGVKARYAGDQGIARVQVVIDCATWLIESHLTLADAVRLHRELGIAVAQMQDRRFRHFELDEDGNEIESGDLMIHQQGGSW